MRRTFGHSLFLVPIWALLLALVLRRFYPRTGLPRLYGLSLLGAAMHLFFDLINSFGSCSCGRFSDCARAGHRLHHRSGADRTAGPAPGPGLHPGGPPRLVDMSRAALACVALYLALCGAGRHLAGRTLAREAAALDAPPNFTYVFPSRSVPTAGGAFCGRAICTGSTWCTPCPGRRS